MLAVNFVTLLQLDPVGCPVVGIGFGNSVIALSHTPTAPGVVTVGGVYDLYHSNVNPSI